MLLWKRQSLYRVRKITWPLEWKCVSVQVCMREARAKIQLMATIATEKLRPTHLTCTTNITLGSQCHVNAITGAADAIRRLAIAR